MAERRSIATRIWGHAGRFECGSAGRTVRRRPGPARPTLLGILAEDASLSYAELGQRLHLSPAAVHERVKRLRRDGVIKGTVARLDGAVQATMTVAVEIEGSDKPAAVAESIVRFIG